MLPENINFFFITAHPVNVGRLFLDISLEDLIKTNILKISVRVCVEQKSEANF